MSKSVPPEHTGPVTRLKVYPDERPKTRGDCASMPRPCPFLSCRYHLGHAWVKPYGKTPPTDDELSDRIASSNDTCTLDVADRGGLDFVEMAEASGVSHQALSATVVKLQRGYRPDAQRQADLALEIASSLSAEEDFDLWSHQWSFSSTGNENDS